MKIGVSLPPDYLAGRVTTATGELIESSCGAADSFLAELRSLDVAAIEVRKIDAQTSPDDAYIAACTVWDAGFELTLHGYLPDTWQGGAVGAMLPPLRKVLNALRDKDRATTITFHSYRSREGSWQQPADKTVTFLSELLRARDKEGLAVGVALELNRARGRVDPSNTYEGLMYMRSKLRGELVGFCWDFGHAHYNVLTAGLPLEPPSEFVTGVIHTHIHDLSEELQTHWPLTQSRVPLDMFVGLLRQAGYSGVYNLELSPSRFHRVAGARDGVFASIERLRAM